MGLPLELLADALVMERLMPSTLVVAPNMPRSATRARAWSSLGRPDGGTSLTASPKRPALRLVSIPLVPDGDLRQGRPTEAIDLGTPSVARISLSRGRGAA